MNAQITFKLDIFNLETELSAEELGKQMEAKVEPILHQVIKAVSENESWIYELATHLKENIPLSENAKEVFEASNISIGEPE